MSYKVQLKQIPLRQSQRFAKDLVVKPIEKKTNFFDSTPKRFTKAIEVEAFDIIEQPDQNHTVYVPFSYGYHFLPSCSPVSTHPKCVLTFQGELLDRQKEIRDETFDILNRTHSVLLCLHTGFGKTIYALYLASKIGLKTVILCHRSIIIDQWVKAIQSYLPSAKVGVWNAKWKTKSPDELPDILVANVLNICKWPRSMYEQYGLLIIDEVHTMCTKKFSMGLLWFTPQYVIGLSATPFRADGMDRLIELYIGPEVVYKQMSRIFNAYRLKTNFEPVVEKLPDGTICWNSVLLSQARSEERNQLICDLVRMFSNRVILVLVKRKDHARVLWHMLSQHGEEVDMFLGTDKVVNYDCRVLIATYSKGGVGFDHPRLDMLITAADVESNFMQYLGRVFRRDATPPIYIDLIDNLGMITKHAATRKQICVEAGGVVREFKKSFPDFELYRRYL